MKKYSNSFYWVMLVLNIIFAGYLVSGWLFAKPAAAVNVIPAELLTENSTVRAEMLKLSESSGNRPSAVALVSSKGGLCAENKIVDLFRTVRTEKPNVKLYILFSRTVTDEEIATFRENFKLDFDVMRMTPDLNDHWEQVSQKYETPEIVILNDGNNLVASKNLAEIKKAVNSYQ
jgi:hypothetical protein